MTALSFGALCFSSLFTVIDPIATAPLFASLTHGASPEQTRRIAWRACAVALGVLVAFALGGAFLFRLFGITLDAFRIGGGIVFVLIGLPMLTRHGEPAPSEHPLDATDATSHDPSVVPLGVPMIGGPGAITTVMVLMGQSESPAQKSVLFAALALVIATTWAILRLAPSVTRRLGRAGLALLTKVMALLLVVVGVQFVVDGLRPIAVDVVRSALAARS
jgi:multiple antibiotic resistance protein